MGQADGNGTKRREVLVCGGGACVSCGCASVVTAFREMLGQRGLREQVKLIETGCVGCCDLGVVVQVMPDNVLYARVTDKDVQKIVEEHLRDDRVVEALLHKSPDGQLYRGQDEMPFFKHQVKVVLENSGLIDPQNIDEYVARDGYLALQKTLGELTPKQIIDEMLASGLRGRGGGGFPTGKKWQMLAAAPGSIKHVVCNGDEGDPGAFMDRSILESDPHRVLEGMLIAGYATGASKGYVYVRAEYPLAIKRLQTAIGQARDKDLLGERVLGTDFSFDLEIRVGAGAFVCGEETALMASVEGRRGMPQPRPPFPTQSGLYGKPTIINNVETYANVPSIIRHGGQWFSKLGTSKSPGTKVFALAGKIRNTGLVEVPMGMTLRQIVFEIGGGVPDGRQFKAAQTGGPSGGCIPAEHLDTPLDFDSLQAIGSIMGSGGLIVMDDKSCMVDVARFFMDFCVDESCGKCPPCRVGTRQMLHMLGRITRGEASMDELKRLEELADTTALASLCGLGMTAPNPVRSTIQHFRNEYEVHIQDKHCAASVCRSLLKFTILLEKCTGCSLCARNCPVSVIHKYDDKRKYWIQTDGCIHCGECFDACRFDAVLKE
ncbi:MAG: NADH-quinone oxidoreductase subunit NuoF [Phycisphaerae bacterium]|nr:NADH-quinone oxidoreductase subunit NuoF [Phycisphaerae bacterium]